MLDKYFLKLAKRAKRDFTARQSRESKKAKKCQKTFKKQTLQMAIIMQRKKRRAESITIIERFRYSIFFSFD